MKCVVWLLVLFTLPLLADPKPIRELVFASCLKQTRPAPALEAIADLSLDVFVWMGDNVYGDTADMAKLRAKYQVVREHPAYARIRASSQVIGTWDDHDYGENDAGKEFAKKAESQQVFLDFLDVPEDSPRRTREGVYACYDYGPDGRKVRVIMLDTRYHRDPIGSDGTMLGQEQWRWLEKMLRGSEAQVNVLVSSIQVLASEHRFEKWSNFPKERQRLLRLLSRADIPPVVILSGDRHLAEISLDSKSCGYPLFEITSSSLNAPYGGNGKEPNRLRVGLNYIEDNFGTLSIDWSRPVPVLTACIRDQAGRPQRALSFILKRRR